MPEKKAEKSRVINIGRMSDRNIRVRIFF